MTTRRHFLALSAAACVLPDWAAAQTTKGTNESPQTSRITAVHPVPTVTLNNGIAMPMLGFGTFGIKPPETAAAVRTALTAGYRLIDTAKNYSNEAEVEQAVAESGVPRSVFINM